MKESELKAEISADTYTKIRAPIAEALYYINLKPILRLRAVVPRDAGFGHRRRTRLSSWVAIQHGREIVTTPEPITRAGVVGGITVQCIKIGLSDLAITSVREGKE